jgi:CBS domain-containing membrane protein
MLKIKDIMTSDVFVLYANDTLELARSLMHIRHVRHVPIVDADGHFVGLLTHRDLLALTVSLLADIDQKEQNELDRHIPIMEVMKTDVVNASPESDVRTAIAVLLENKYGCLPVVSGKKLVGIVTEADFLKLTYDLLKDAAEN